MKPTSDNKGGRLGDSVSGSSVGDGGGFRADGGETGNDLGGVLCGSRAGGVANSGADNRVRVSRGSNWVSSSRAGFVLSRIAVAVGVGGGNKASDDSEGVHVDC